ncbi:Trypsin-like serine protease [Rhodobacterales bacterium HTCC2150]|nr:Trypsin-like serine protease [Rhodobacterales bacterium HTCC2150] [Rhodobacteraceae bacterium HTCC2150]
MKSSFQKYVREAHRRGLSCGVRGASVSPQFKPNVQTNFAQASFRKLSTIDRKKIQSVLHSKGFYSGRIDGLWGNQTASALNKYISTDRNAGDFDSTNNAASVFGIILNNSILAENDRELRREGSGTAFYVSPLGHMLTAYHVIDECKETHILKNGVELKADVIGYDKSNDLALLYSEEPVDQFFAISDESPKLMQDVFVAGFPFGDRFSVSVKVTRGIVSSTTGFRRGIICKFLHRQTRSSDTDVSVVI